MKGQSLVHVAEVIEPRFVTSARECQDPCSEFPTDQELLEVRFELPFNVICQSNTVVLNWPTMAFTQILVHSRTPKTRISALALRQT